MKVRAENGSTGAQAAERHTAPPGLSLDLGQMLESLDEEDRRW